MINANSFVEEIINSFKNYILNQNLSVKTAQNSAPDIREFLVQLNIQSINDIANLTPIAVEKYLTYLREKKYAAGTKKVKVARVRTFFNYLVDMEYITKNVMRGKKISAPKARVQSFPHSDVVKVLYASENIREYVLLHTLMGAALRVGELVNLRCADILKDNRIQVTHGKGDKFRTVKCPKEVIVVLKDYIERTKNVRKSPYVFITRFGTQMCREEVWRILKAMAKRANIDNWEKFSPHKVRHTYGAYCFNKLQIPLDVISKNLGHSSIAITSQFYAETGDERVEKYVDGINETSFFGRKEHYFDV